MRCGSPRPAEILLSPAFVAAVLLLVVNDWILKAAYGSWWTGKLSDFTGLYAVALFWSAFVPRRRTLICVLTGVAFLVWKSPLSSAPIAAWNSLGLWPVGRVVDYTDSIALVALVPAARSAYTFSRPVLRHWAANAHRIAVVTMVVLAAVAFMASETASPHFYAYPSGTEYHVAGERAAVRTYFRAYAWYSHSTEPGVAVDTLSVIDSLSGGLLRITLRDAVPCGTEVTLVDIELNRDFNRTDASVTLGAARQKFEHDFIATLRLFFPACS